MEVLQKITVYDLLGYTVPGSVLIAVIQICFHDGIVDLSKYGKHLGYYVAVIILLGYITGLILSEVSSILNAIIIFLLKPFKKGLDKFKKIIFDEEELSTIGCKKATEALVAAGIIKKGTKLSKKKVKKYYGYMYADIQADSRYSRVHNYASSELVCSNLSLVVAISSVLLSISRPELLNGIGLVIGLVSSVLLYIRSIKQRNRKLDYTLDWFIQKNIK